ncbi:MAG: TetR family transcriptional regulator C-terminal domain-containing protein [Pseudomonadota bacterium]
MSTESFELEKSDDLRSKRFAPKEVRRQQLIEATLKVIAEKGVSGTTMSAITGTAGLSTGIVSLHFYSKDNLLKSTLEYLAIEFRDHWHEVATDNSLSAAQKIWGILETNFAPQICTPEKIRVWYAFFGEAQYRDVYRDIVKSFDLERSDVLEELFAELGLSVDASDSLTEVLESLADGLWLNMMLYPEWVEVEGIKQHLWNLLSLHFPEHFLPQNIPSLEAAR